MHQPPDRLVESDSHKRFSDDHADLMADVARLRDARTPAAAAEVFRRIAAAIPGHFVSEDERDGLFDWLIALIPDRADDVEVLRTDHISMINMMNELAEPMSTDAPSAGALERVQAFAERLVDHERRESRLVREAVQAANS